MSTMHRPGAQAQPGAVKVRVVGDMPGIADALHVILATDILVVEMSFGKWSHMIYRPLGLYLLAVRERASRQAFAAEVVSRA